MESQFEESTHLYRAADDLGFRLSGGGPQAAVLLLVAEVINVLPYYRATHHLDSYILLTSN